MIQTIFQKNIRRKSNVQKGIIIKKREITLKNKCTEPNKETIGAKLGNKKINIHVCLFETQEYSKQSVQTMMINHIKIIVFTTCNKKSKVSQVIDKCDVKTQI